MSMSPLMLCKGDIAIFESFWREFTCIGTLNGHEWLSWTVHPLEHWPSASVSLSRHKSLHCLVCSILTENDYIRNFVYLMPYDQRIQQIFKGTGYMDDEWARNWSPKFGFRFCGGRCCKSLWVWPSVCTLSSPVWVLSAASLYALWSSNKL